MRIPVLQVATPSFWLSSLGRVQDYLTRHVNEGVLHELGSSSLGSPIRAVEYPREGCPKLMVVGGCHGHEPGTVASSMNLIHLMETGTDLDGREHPALMKGLERVHLYVVPCLNPDGRAVCPDSFYAQTGATCTLYASGVQKNGDPIPYDSGADEPLYYFDPKEAAFVGGQFTGGGYAANRRLSLEKSDAVEVQRLLDFVQGLDIEAVFDLHACGFNFAFQVGDFDPVYWPVLREWQRRAEKVFGEKGRQLSQLNGDGDPPKKSPYHNNSHLFYERGKLLWIFYEGRQGYLGRRSLMPFPTEWEIIDDYLTAVGVFLELGVEGQYAAANGKAFGG